MSTFLGIISGITLLFIAIFQQSGYKVFLNPPALMITLGGTVAAIFISFPLPEVFRVARSSLQIFRKDIEKPLWVIAIVVRMAFKARRQSLLSLEKDFSTVKNRFLKIGLEMVIDGHTGETIRDVLETEADFVQIRHRGGAHIFKTAGKYAPAFGLIGTLIGLVSMLQNLGVGGGDAAQQIGSGMAVALITTFYGAMMANLFFFPVAEKLTSRSGDEMLTIRIIIEGVLMIQAGVNPRMVETKLNSFLPPHLRGKHFERQLKKSKKVEKEQETETVALDETVKFKAMGRETEETDSGDF